MGLDEKQIANRLGLTIVHVRNLLDLVAAPVDVRSLVTTGKVSATTAIKTMKDHGVEASTILKEAVQDAETLGKERATAKNVKKVVAKKAPETPTEDRQDNKKEAPEPQPAVNTDTKPEHSPFDAEPARHAEPTAADTTPESEPQESMGAVEPSVDAVPAASTQITSVPSTQPTQVHENPDQVKIRGRFFTVGEVENLFDAAYDALDVLQELGDSIRTSDIEVVTRLCEVLRVEPKIRVKMEEV